jgi:CHAT domain-containing protein
LYAQDYIEQIKNAYNDSEFEKCERLALKHLKQETSGESKAEIIYYLAKSQNSAWKYHEALENFLYLEKHHQNFLNKKHELKISVYSNIAIIYTDLRDYAGAEEYYAKNLRAIKQALSKDQKKYYILHYNNVGLHYLYFQQYNKAIDYCKKSLEIRRELSSQYTFIPLVNIAHAFLKLNKNDSAVYYNKLALKEIQTNYKSDFSVYYAVLHNNIGDNLLKLGDNNSIYYFKKALTRFEELFDNNNPYTSISYYNIGNYYYNNNQYDSALMYYEKSIVSLIPNDEKYMNGLTNSISPIDMLDAVHKKSLTQFQIGKQQNDLTHYSIALQTIETAIKIIEKTRNSYRNRESQLIFTASQKKIFNLAIYLASTAYQKTGEQKYLTKFYEFSEKAKANVLLLAIRNLEAKEFGGIPEKLIKKERNLVREIAYLEEIIYEMENANGMESQIEKQEAKLSGLKLEYDSLISHFEKNYKQYFQLKYNYDYVSMHTVQSELQTHQALIHFYKTDSLLFRCTITSDSARLEQIPLNQTFNQAFNTYYTSLSDFDHTNHTRSDYINYVQSANTLYNTIIPRLDKSITEIIAIPDEFLAQLPFDAFLSYLPDTLEINYKSLPYLIKKYSFSYNYSSTLLYNKQFRADPAYQKLLAFAPDYENGIVIGEHNKRSIKYRENLYPIPGAVKEISNISKLVDSEVYLNNNATETIFKTIAGDFNLLHLAMHTIIDNANPMFSKLAFSGADTVNDGLLNTHEIYNLQLNSKLTVLSACNSGSGKVQKAEGIMSLARGFIYAGCPSVVMTLWRIEDLSSARLMTMFYKNLKNGNHIAQSLQLSKCNYLSQTAKSKCHPYFWSGYISIGENQQLYPNSRYIYLVALVLVIVLSGSVLIYIKRKK